VTEFELVDVRAVGGYGEPEVKKLAQSFLRFRFGFEIPRVKRLDFGRRFSELFYVVPRCRAFRLVGSYGGVDVRRG
jgi:hypothetical protein